jgi:hypothetical protein
MQSKILSELQFCQMENETIRANLKTRKEKIKDTRKQIARLFDEIAFLGSLDDKSIILTKENQNNILSMIDELIN